MHNNQVKLIASEKWIIDKENYSLSELKVLFTKKYFNMIKDSKCE